MATNADLAKVLASITLAADLGLTLTSVEVAGLCQMTNRQAAHLVAELLRGGRIAYDPESGGFVPCQAPEAAHRCLDGSGGDEACEECEAEFSARDIEVFQREGGEGLPRVCEACAEAGARE